MKSKIIYPILLLGLFWTLFFYLPKIGRENGVKLTIKKINEEYKGVVIDKYAVRDTPPTHLKIRVSDYDIDICPNKEITKEVIIGDSIIKPKNENIIYLIKPDGTRKQFYYIKLSFKTRNSDFFPKEWKNKWLESSEFDYK